MFAEANMDADPGKAVPAYDPIHPPNYPQNDGILIGSGPWECYNFSINKVGSGCSSDGYMNPGPGGSYTFERFGHGTNPAGSLNGAYSRSAGTLALYLWSGNNGDFNHDFLNFGAVAGCYGQAVQPLPPNGMPSGCAHWQEGIGGMVLDINGNPQPSQVSNTQIGIVNRFLGLNWVQPFQWTSSPPTGITERTPVLYEGISTGGVGNPFASGRQQILFPASNDPQLAPSAGCSRMYPVGGYDC
jgi:hypothetical protein